MCILTFFFLFSFNQLRIDQSILHFDLSMIAQIFSAFLLLQLYNFPNFFPCMIRLSNVLRLAFNGYFESSSSLLSSSLSPSPSSLAASAATSQFTGHEMPTFTAVSPVLSSSETAETVAAAVEVTPYRMMMNRYSAKSMNKRRSFPISLPSALSLCTAELAVISSITSELPMSSCYKESPIRHDIDLSCMNISESILGLLPIHPLDLFCKYRGGVET